MASRTSISNHEDGPVKAAALFGEPAAAAPVAVNNCNHDTILNGIGIGNNSDNNLYDVIFPLWSQQQQGNSASAAAMGGGDIQLPPLDLPPLDARNHHHHRNQVNNNGLAAAAAAASAASKNSALAGDNETTLLHRSCQQFPQECNVIKAALSLYPKAAGRRMSINVTQAQLKSSMAAAAIQERFVAFPQGRHYQKKAATKQRKERFGYPLNIALDHGASLDVIVRLACAAPRVLTLPDGSGHNRKCTSLMIALMKYPKPLVSMVVEALLTVNPLAVVLPDGRKNLPLHLAVQHSAPLEVFLQLHGLFPDAIHMANFHGETPVMIAQRNSHCPEKVLNFLMKHSN